MKRIEVLPFRQDDPDWGHLIMWDRDEVIRANIQGNGASLTDSQELLRKFSAGNTIANEGCQLTCLAMILHLLSEEGLEAWTPGRLHRESRERTFITRAGLSLVQLYADLVQDVSDGEIQLAAKEEFLSGEPGWPRNDATSSWIIKAYRKLSPTARRDFVIMLKIGTHDDSVASHYVILHPDRPGSMRETNPEILDPAMPFTHEGTWTLVDSGRHISKDRTISRAWKSRRISARQLSGVFLFGRWRTSKDRALIEPILRAAASTRPARRAARSKTR
jgi:hypothetical protein